MSSPATPSADGLTLGALAVQVGELTERVSRLESEPCAAPLAPAETIEQIRAVTEQLFPGPVSMRVSLDPESPHDQWIVFDVEAEGTYADFRDREFAWYEAVAKLIAEGQTDVRLCIMPKQ